MNRSKRSGTYLWVGHLVSTLGERLTYASLIILSGELSGLRLGTTLILVIYSLTFVFAAPLAGRLVDHQDKRWVLIGSDVGRAFLVLCYNQVLFFHSSLLSHIGFYLSVAVVVALSAIARAGFWSIIPDSVARKDIRSLNIRIAVNSDVAMAVGTALGGLLAARLSFAWIFGFDALTYLLSGFSLLFISYRYKRPVLGHSADAEAPPIVSLPGEIVSSQILLRIVLITAPLNVLLGMVNYYMVIGVETVFHKPVAYVGYVFSIWATGGVVAGLLMQKYGLSARMVSLRSLYWAYGAASTWALIFVYTRSLAVFFCALGAAGFTFATATVLTNNIGMLHCKSSVTGRFSALLIAVMRISMLVGLVLASLGVNWSNLFPLAVSVLAVGLLLVIKGSSWFLWTRAKGSNSVSLSR